MMADLMALFGGKNTKAKTVCNIFCGKLLLRVMDLLYKTTPYFIVSGIFANL